MGTKDKLLKRLQSRPKDFTFNELETLLKYLGYTLSNQGASSGSRVAFSHPDRAPIMLHKPHPRKELLDYQVKQILEQLCQEGLL